ncbi:hypothetical protein BD560DRAFT_405114 [Blakeslea trispora]|nr:hypothetical protein BD560DRAFT_405114 [Blakeslea trispora]
MYQTLLQDSYYFTHQQQMRRMSHEDSAYLSSDASFSSQENSPLNGNLDYYPSIINYGHMPFPQQPTEKLYPVMYLASQQQSSNNLWSPSMYQNYMIDPLQSPIVSSQRMTPSLSSTSSNSSSLDQCQLPGKKKSTAKKMRKRTEVACSQPEHQVTKQFSCDYENCGKVFRRSEHLKRHIKSIHTREKPYECPYDSCGKRFSRTDNLSQHIRIHRPKKTNQQSISRKRTNNI